MLLRFLAIAGLTAAFLFAGPTFAVPSKQKMETCKFGADSKKLQGAERKKFIDRCMSDKDEPRGTGAAKAQ